MENDEEIFGPKFLEIFEKLNILITEKEKFENSKKNLVSEIETTKHKIDVIKSATPLNKQLSELEKREKELLTYLKTFKDQSEGFESIKQENTDLQEKKEGFENEINLIVKNMEELTKLQVGIEKEIKVFENNLINTQREIEINGMKYKDLLEKYKNASQVRNLKKIEIENSLQKFNEIKKNKNVNRALLKNQEIALENNYKALANKIEETSSLLNSYLEITNNNEKLQFISKKYMDKVHENNKIREENENLKEKINSASVKNFQLKLQSVSPTKKRSVCKENNENEKYETLKLNLEKIKRLIVDINIIQNKK